MGTTSMKPASSKARPPAGGKASNISAVIEAPERAGVRSGLSVEARTTVECVAVAEAAVAKVAMAKVTVVEITVMESAVTEVSAVRDERVMVEECSTPMPVVSPVAPAPPKASEVPDSKSNAERESDAAPKNPGHRIPAWVRDDGRAIHQPRIISW